jgi:hypothetical protein
VKLIIACLALHNILIDINDDDTLNVFRIETATTEDDKQLEYEEEPDVEATFKHN